MEPSFQRTIISLVAQWTSSYTTIYNLCTLSQACVFHFGVLGRPIFEWTQLTTCDLRVSVSNVGQELKREWLNRYSWLIVSVLCIQLSGASCGSHDAECIESLWWNKTMVSPAPVWHALNRWSNRESNAGDHVSCNLLNVMKYYDIKI
jgi:hypothetical protein